MGMQGKTYEDGVLDGRREGCTEGFKDGCVAGYQKGYREGFADGRSSCGPLSIPAKKPAQISVSDCCHPPAKTDGLPDVGPNPIRPVTNGQVTFRYGPLTGRLGRGSKVGGPNLSRPEDLL